MKNFFKLAEGVDPAPLLHQITLQPQLWNANRLRKDYPGSPHAQASDIWLSFQPERDQEEIVDAAFRGFDIDEHECQLFDGWWRLPAARTMIFALMRQVEGLRLGRVVITKLPPGGQIFAHADGGSPATYYERHQIALQCRPGVTFTCGDEALEQRTGDVIWFDNTQVHSVVNNSDDDRIVMIVDVRCAK